MGLIFLELLRGLRKPAAETIGDAEPPMRRILRGIERDYFLKVRLRGRKPAACFLPWLQLVSTLL
jgi:hypothetical protein